MSTDLRVNPSQSYEASPAIQDHTMLPVTRHRWTCPTFIPACRQTDTRFTYPRGMEGWVDLSGSLYTEMVYTQTVTHPSINHMIATRRVKPTTSW